MAKVAKLKFYLREPSYAKRSLMYAYGGMAIWSPALLTFSLAPNDLRWQLVTYAGLGGLMCWKTSRDILLGIHESFYKSWKKFRTQRRASKVLRDVMDNAGLVQREKRNRTTWGGKEEKIDVTTFPHVEISADEFNYYLQFHVLAGQTSAEWERKVDAFAQALGCHLVKAKIDRGVIDLTLQHTGMNVTEVIRKNDTQHVLYIGYTPGGLLEWKFDLDPNLLVVGVVGAGKSTFVRQLLTQIPKSWTLKIVDGKQVEFTYMKDFGYDVCDNHEGFLKYVDDAIAEMDRRYALMTQQRKNHYTEVEGLEPYFLVCDEWISLVESLSKNKKQGESMSDRDKFFAKVKTLSTKGRASGVQLVAILQRPDAEFLSGIVRDMFVAKVLLKGSKTSAKMMYDDDGKDLSPLSVGQGYCSMDDIKNFSFPDYSLDSFVEDLQAKHRIAQEVEETERELEGIGVPQT